MYARRVVPILLMVGAVMMIMKHNRRRFIGQCEESEQHRQIGPRGEWGKRVPPLFDAKRWHKRAHEQETQPAAI